MEFLLLQVGGDERWVDPLDHHDPVEGEGREQMVPESSVDVAASVEGRWR